MAKAKYSVKKYNGDDNYSYAVFNAADVRGMGSQIFYGDARPIVCGMDRRHAQSHKKSLENAD